MTTPSNSAVEVLRADRQLATSPIYVLTELIFSGVYRPQPCMSGRVLDRASPLQLRGCHDAADAILKQFPNLTAPATAGQADEVAELRTKVERLEVDLAEATGNRRWVPEARATTAEAALAASQAKVEKLREALFRLKTECEIEGLDKRAGFDCWISTANEALNRAALQADGGLCP